MILDRNPRLALAAGGSILAGTAVVPVTRPVWHPVCTPYILGAAVVAADVVIVPAVLGRVVRAVRMVWRLAAIALGGVLAAWEILTRLPRGPYEVLEVHEAVYLGAVGGLVAGGALTPAGTGPQRSRRPRGQSRTRGPAGNASAW